MKRKHSYTYVITDNSGNITSVNAPNAKVARERALSNTSNICSCQRAFKRGGNLGHQIMKKSDCLFSL